MWTNWAKAKMSMREAMIVLAGKPCHGEQPRWFAQIAAAANISTRAARSLWRGEIQDHNHRAAVAVRRALELKQARDDAKALVAQYQSIIGGLRVQDEDFFGPTIDRLERLVRDLSNLDRT